MGTEADIATFIARYAPEVAAEIRAARARLRKRIPRGHEMVYDNYQSLVFGFSPTERPSDAPLSIAAMPRWVTLCFLKGAKLKDPKKLLKGEGTTVRSVRLMGGASDIAKPEIAALIDQALALQEQAFDAAPKLTTTIRSISARQRPRRPKP